MAACSGPSSSAQDPSRGSLGLIYPLFQRELFYFSNAGPDSISKIHRLFRATTDVNYDRMNTIFNIAKDSLDEMLDQFLAGKDVEAVKRFEAVVERFKVRYEQKNRDASKVADPVYTNIQMAQAKVQGRIDGIASEFLSDFDIVEEITDPAAPSTSQPVAPQKQLDVAAQTLEATRRLYIASCFIRDIKNPVIVERFYKGTVRHTQEVLFDTDLPGILKTYSLPILFLAVNDAADTMDLNRHTQLQQMIKCYTKYSRSEFKYGYQNDFEKHHSLFERLLIMHNPITYSLNNKTNPAISVEEPHSEETAEAIKLKRRIAGMITVVSEGIVSTNPVDLKEYFEGKLDHFERFLKLTASNECKRSTFLRRFIDLGFSKESVMQIIDGLFEKHQKTIQEKCGSQYSLARGSSLLARGSSLANPIAPYKPTDELLSEAADFVFLHNIKPEPQVSEMPPKPADPSTDASAPLYPSLPKSE